ncbi:hypothetical protein AB0F91_28230 [Amycolatopsis sp. NPDC023774]|uniref:hypothetical protein n=1 Tax=Amycolatopsis sp. NPDC023774 TaxID=3155015 RepID=UPI0033EC6EE6
MDGRSPGCAAVEHELDVNGCGRQSGDLDEPVPPVGTADAAQAIGVQVVGPGVVVFRSSTSRWVQWTAQHAVTSARLNCPAGTSMASPAGAAITGHISGGALQAVRPSRRRAAARCLRTSARRARTAGWLHHLCDEATFGAMADVGRSDVGDPDPDPVLDTGAGDSRVTDTVLVVVLGGGGGSDCDCDCDCDCVTVTGGSG